MDTNKLEQHDKHIIDSSLLIFHNTDSLIVKVESLDEIIGTIWSDDWIAYNDYLLSLMNKNLEKSLKENDTGVLRYYGTALNNKGYWFYSNSKRDSALHYYKLAEKYKRKYSPEKDLPAIYNNIGSILTNQGKYSEALEIYFKGVAINEKHNKKKGLAYFYNNIGALYYNRENFKKAVEYNKKALKLRQEINDTLLICSSLSNLAFSYSNNEQTDSAILLINESLKYREQINDQKGICYSKVFLADFNLKNKNIVLAKQYASEALEISKTLNFSNPFISASKVIGQIEFEKKNYQTAKAYIKPAYKKAKKNKNVIQTQKTAELYYQIEEQLGNYKHALELHKLYKKITDSINKAKTSRELISKEFQFDYDKKEAIIKNQIEQVKTEKLLNDQKNKQIIYNLLWLIAIALIIGLLIFFVQRNKAKRKIEDLRNQALRLQINPHFFFNAMNSINNFIAFNESQKARNYLTKFAKVMRLSLESVQDDFISLKKETTYLTNYMEIEKLRFKNFDYIINIDDILNQELTGIPPILIQPFIENAILHGFKSKSENERGLITLNFNKKDNRIVVEIIDNGSGIDTNKKSNKEHKSLALIICKKRLAILNKRKDNIHFSSPQNSTGTVVSFSIPQINLN